MGENNPNYGKTLNHRQRKILSNSQLGTKNHNYDYTIYHFVHKSGDTFVGTRNDFYKKFDLDARSVRKFIRGKFKTIAGWKLLDDYVN